MLVSAQPAGWARSLLSSPWRAFPCACNGPTAFQGLVRIPITCSGMRKSSTESSSLNPVQVAISAARLARTPLSVTRLVISAAAAGAEAVAVELAAPVPQAEAHLRFTRGSPHKVRA